MSAYDDDTFLLKITAASIPLQWWNQEGSVGLSPLSKIFKNSLLILTPQSFIILSGIGRGGLSPPNNKTLEIHLLKIPAHQEFELCLLRKKYF